MLTAGTGMDALGHCIEGFLYSYSNSPLEAIALDGVTRVVNFIERAVRDAKAWRLAGTY